MPHITFVHGISNKPAPDALHDLWRRALARGNGIDLGAAGVTSSMVYWADVMYASPDAAVESLEAIAALEAAGQFESAESMEEMREVVQDGTRAAGSAWRERLEGEERRLVEALADRIGADLADPAAGAPGVPPVPATPTEAAAAVVLERVPLPWVIKRPLMKLLLRDVHHYLFNESHAPRPGSPAFAVQDEIRSRFLRAVQEGSRMPGPHIVVSHSMGTVVAYDCLKRVAACPQVDALVTIGSPLGLDEIQDRFRPEWERDRGFPAEKVKGEWINVFDRLDPVAGFDPAVANDYKQDGRAAVNDIEEPNWGPWRHSITKYLQGPLLRARLGELLGVEGVL